jgi:hypothetical protein
VDCNDGNATIHSAANELCDGIDNNCNATVDDGVVRLRQLLAEKSR